MFVDIMLRRRPSLDEAIPEFNAKLLDALSRVSGFWGEGKSMRSGTMKRRMRQSKALRYFSRTR